ncbi:MAG TPA: hypothetical protein VF110_03420 [Burkholderiales bacterium]
MHALLLTWDLSARKPEVISALRKYVASESWGRYRDVPGLVEKTWFSDEKAMLFGAFYLWETAIALERELADPHSIEELTGVKPTVHRFEVEAIQEGEHQTDNRFAAGKAWSPDAGALLTSR